MFIQAFFQRMRPWPMQFRRLSSPFVLSCFFSLVLSKSVVRYLPFSLARFFSLSLPPLFFSLLFCLEIRENSTASPLLLCVYLSFTSIQRAWTSLIFGFSRFIPHFQNWRFSRTHTHFFQKNPKLIPIKHRRKGKKLWFFVYGTLSIRCIETSSRKHFSRARICLMLKCHIQTSYIP